MEKRPPTPPEASEFHPEKIINGNFKGKDFLSVEQLDRVSLGTIFRYIPMMEDICLNSKKNDTLAGIGVSVWFDKKSASTRTFMSINGGIKQLGGYTNVKPENSSDNKGESFEDSILILEMNGDLIAIRHSEGGAVAKAAQIAKRVPVMNLGDKEIGHPTQTIGDLYLANKHSGLSNQIAVVARDPRYSRSIHSFLDGLAMAGDNNEICSFAQKELQLSKDQVKKYERAGLKVNLIDNPDDLPKHYNIYYSNRLQLEHWPKELQPEHERLDTFNRIDNEFMKRHGCPEMILMHPLPRVNEIAREVDKDSRARYLEEQIRYAHYGRMATAALQVGRINPNVIGY